MASERGWLLPALRRRDPGLRTIRRAVRVTVAACIGFYCGRYVLGSAVLATYALFGCVALGVLSQIPGAAPQKARTLVTILPAAWFLVTAGTVLAVSDVAAAAGMFVLGFAVSYAGVGGPRLVGVTNGLQLLYILPCFPPYDPGSLGPRLLGVSIGVLLLALAELIAWPDAAPRPYRAVLADAVAGLAGSLVAASDFVGGGAEGRGPSASEQDRSDLLSQLPAALAAAEALRPSALDPVQRPASASRTDRALAQAGGSVRYVIARVAEFVGDAPHQLGAPAAAALLRQCAATSTTTARWLRGTGAPPEPEEIGAAMTRFRLARRATDPTGVHPDRLRRGAQALATAEGLSVLVGAVRVAGGLRLHPDTTPATSQPGPFWYAYQPPWSLIWHRFRLHLTPRSVYFQGALRLALALAAARLVAGVLELSHGFWVLLAILTTMRASAAQTRTLLWPALAGTAIGAIVAGGVLLVVDQSHVYEVALPVLMVAGFAAGPLLGQVWGQALFTLVIAVVFAQVGPRNWRLAEARLVDVLAGLGIGVLIGLLAWPRGGAGELRRAAANLMSASAGVVTETVQVLAGGDAPGQALPVARRRDEFAEASYSLYQSEPRQAHPAPVDWQATLVAARHALRGAEALLHARPPAPLSECTKPLRAESHSVAAAYLEAGTRIAAGQPVRLAAARVRADEWPTDLGPELYHLADLRVWLDGLDEDLLRLPARPLVDQGRMVANEDRTAAIRP